MTGARGGDRPDRMASEVTYQLDECLVLSVVKAARKMTRKYDAQLRGHGVTVAQFSLMAAVRSNPGCSVHALAVRIDMERTALSRNLTVLERRGLIARADEDLSARVCTLTAQGDAVLDKVLPEWQRVQDEMRAVIGAENADQFLHILRQLSV